MTTIDLRKAGNSNGATSRGRTLSAPAPRDAQGNGIDFENGQSDRRKLEITKIAGFLRSIGISVEFASAIDGFQNGIAIVRGHLVVDVDTCRISSLLHEAGHIAVIPGCWRSKISGTYRIA